MSIWTPFRTLRGAQKYLRPRHWAIALGVSWVIPPLAFILLVFVTREGAEFSYRAFRDIYALFPFLYMIAILSFPPLLFGSAIMNISLRFGYGGWGTAMVSGGGVAILTFYILTGGYHPDNASLAIVGFFGVIYASTFWLILRWQAPRAFVLE